MKKALLFFCLFSYYLGNSQSQKIIRFDYDNAGNQILRELCLGCQLKNNQDSNPLIDVTDLKDENLIQFFPNDIISYYPNPVKEELFLKWELINEKNVNSIEVYSLNGVLLKKYSNQTHSNSYNISFGNYPDGIYTVLLIYTNGEKKDIRIIKK